MKGGSGGMRARRALEVRAARKSTPVVSIDEVEPKQIVNDADLLEEAMDYFLQKKNLPDISDRPTIHDKDMCLWLKQKKKSRLRPHSVLKGVCGSWLNTSYDYAFERNMWAVVFKGPQGNTIDCVTETMVMVWIKYVSFMVRIYTTQHIYNTPVYTQYDTSTVHLYTHNMTCLQHK